MDVPPRYVGAGVVSARWGELHADGVQERHAVGEEHEEREGGAAQHGARYGEHGDLARVRVRVRVRLRVRVRVRVRIRVRVSTASTATIEEESSPPIWSG